MKGEKTSRLVISSWEETYLPQGGVKVIEDGNVSFRERGWYLVCWFSGLCCVLVCVGECMCARGLCVCVERLYFAGALYYIDKDLNGK